MFWGKIMMHLKIRQLIFLILFLSLSSFSYAQSCIGTPDLVLINGVILTMDAENTTATSVHIRGNKFIAVNNNPDTSGDCVQVIDLGGRTVIPGLIDSHTHFNRTAQAPGPFILGQEASTSIKE